MRRIDVAVLDQSRHFAKRIRSFKENGVAMSLNEAPFEPKLTTLVTWICRAKQVVWFTGAGVSTESGLPDFRGPDGVWTRRAKGLPLMEKPKPMNDLEPNAAHFAITDFQSIGKCDFLISQNVDNLHLRSGFPFEKLAELHGNTQRVICRHCDKTYPVVHESVYRGTSCPTCREPLQESVVDFGDPLPVKDLQDSIAWAEKADLMIVVGSSCQVAPAADIPLFCKRTGGKIAVVNVGDTALDDVADLKFSQKAGELLPRLLDKVRTSLQ